MNLELFNYHLPDQLIAQYPSNRRGESRMLVVDRVTGETVIRPFSDLTEYVDSGDAIIVNNTRVMNARMFGIKSGNNATAKIEIMLIGKDNNSSNVWNAFIKPGKRVSPGTKIKLSHMSSSETCKNWVTVIEHLHDGSFKVEFDSDDMELLQSRYGYLPLPPYIHHIANVEDSERYQTVFAKSSGAVAAPTAGLHFTPDFLDELSQKGVKIGELTLHVGPGTFKPVVTQDISQHKMHQEKFILPQDTADLINSVHNAKRKVLAVGTTTVRVIESCADKNGVVHPHNGVTDIFLHPPYQPVATDMLLTNFHLPKSTLLMLVSTFATREKILSAYEHAIREKLHFYSYGDCMLLK
jgi:S-adenosylmethionine:tRNA ribosyltransferase-isomerase